jgi:hypothetical protein
VWSRKQCRSIQGPGYQTIKEIDRIYATYPQFTPSNTAMFDDSPLKLNHIPNGVLVDTYIPCEEIDNSDRELLRVQEIIRRKMC